ncbi:MAG TPA: hypothetical protein VHU87_13135 [Rhizomicrobium sp.]|jgi:hypothetical protein|nr:hypothetical protein [Rhizomicrobium sp.]
MKSLALAIVLLAGPAFADTSHTCLRSMDIDHTSVPDGRTLLFHMKDGHVWKNALMNDCPGLKFNGFIYDASPNGEICGNLQTIRVLHTGSVCMLGPFTPAPSAVH